MADEEQKPQSKIYTIVGYKLSIYDLEKLDTREEEVKKLVHPQTKPGDEDHCANNVEEFKFCPDCGKPNYEITTIVDDIYTFNSDLIDFHFDKEKYDDLTSYISSEYTIKDAKDFQPVITPLIEKEKSCYLALMTWEDNVVDKPTFSITDVDFVRHLEEKTEYEKGLSQKSQNFLKNKDFGIYVFGVGFEDFLGF